MAQSIPLITALDGFQKVRDAVADILAIETAAQQVLAVAAGQDPDLWKFDVYAERTNPWETFRDGTGDLTPIVNVWYDSTQFNKSASNMTKRQKADPSLINVDVYAFASSAAALGGGHTSGDETASRLAQNVLKLCRNILMHDRYLYLGLRGTVWHRWVDKMVSFQPGSSGQPLNRVAACRLVLAVGHDEVVEFEEPETLELINVKMRHEVGGKIIAELEYESSP